MNSGRIVLYGHFGSGNVGNDSSLEAALENLRTLCPAASLSCVCDDPEVVRSRFGIEAVAIDDSSAMDRWRAVHSKWAKLKWILSWPLTEIRLWVRRVRWFRDVDLFAVVGTGAVDDMAVRAPWDAPFALYKWCRCAKSGGAVVAFVSVGVGPIVHPLNRFLMLRALRLADRRSYRETAALDYLGQVGFDTRGDAVAPDLVFSLPSRRGASLGEIAPYPMAVGLGLISYYGWTDDREAGQQVFERYMSHMKRFAGALIERGHRIRILVGDAVDQGPAQQMMDHLGALFPSGRGERFVAETIASVDDLLEQIAQVEVVVASRFHNVLCSLMIGRPVVSIGYHEKNRLLMTDIGLAEYCQDIETLDYDRLLRQFNACWEARERLGVQVRDRIGGYRALLDEQYRSLLTGIGSEK